MLRYRSLHSLNNSNNKNNNNGNNNNNNNNNNNSFLSDVIHRSSGPLHLQQRHCK